jgi:hypothetical protein
VAGRALNIERKAMPADVAYSLEWKREEHDANVTSRLLRSPCVSSNSTLWHASAKQCMHLSGLGFTSKHVR